MGLFKDLGDTKRQAKELSRNAPGTGARLSEMNQKMAALTSSLEASTVGLAARPEGSAPVEVQVLSVEPATGYVNGDPVVRVTVLVLMGGAPPVPATQSIVVPALQVHRLSPGVRLAALVDPRNIEAFVLDWNASA